jgi:PleD family two-component response regulator
MLAGAATEPEMESAMRVHNRSHHPTPALDILLVGQHQVILQAMKLWLAPLGHRLTWVKDELEAIHEIHQRHFDMVVTQQDPEAVDSSVIVQYLRSAGDPATVVRLDPRCFDQATSTLEAWPSVPADLTGKSRSLTD